ncbi:hypothetical protein EXN22_03810 [Pseudomonas tructae]|uniref:Dermonecrotic toxin N-terminal domain-containing protein n=1 Tax=Pseudomonas tructae TaxID=2518644 RepID=A0A411MDE1_9PSED|nr:DUF6543 domain-containing protein [Pseudomonas tructae]QBF24862.1 hypothetical protein EXN22_03810 [Pseudomonas tructae]
MSPHSTTLDGNDEKKMPIAVTESEEATQQLLKTDEEIWRMLQLRPNFQAMAERLYLEKLLRKFPGLPQSFDPDELYLTEYIDHYDKRDNNSLPTRQITSTNKLSAILQTAINTGQIPTYDSGATGFYYSPTATADSDRVTVISEHGFEKVLEEVLEVSMHDYRHAVDKFWSQPHNSLGQNATPSHWLGARLCAQRRQEGELLRIDGTLMPEAKNLLDRLLATETDVTNVNQPGKFSLALQDSGHSLPVHGAIVVTDSPTQQPDKGDAPVLVLLPGQGLMVFTNGADFSNNMRALLSDRHQRELLKDYVTEKERSRIEAISNGLAEALPFSYPPIDGPAFTHSVRGLLEQQKQNIVFATQNARKGHAPSFMTVDQTAAHLASKLHAGAIIESRNQKIFDKRLPDWLKNSSPKQRDTWNAYSKAYYTSLINNSSISQHEYIELSAPAALLRYSRKSLSDIIRHVYGRGDDPDKIFITKKTLNLEEDTHLATSLGWKPETKSLTELGLSNVSWFDTINIFVTVTITDELDQPIEWLDIWKIRNIVQIADIADTYDKKLQRLVTDENRQSYVATLHAALRLQLLEAEMRQLMSANCVAIVQAALARPDASTREKINNRGVTVNAVMIGDAAVQDVITFETLPSGSGKLVVYLPNVVEGEELREFANHNDLWSWMSSSQKIKDYLLGRVPAHSVAKARSILNGDPGPSGADWSIENEFHFYSASPPDYSYILAQLEYTLHTRPIAGDFLKKSFDTQISNARTNADTLTTSNTEKFKSDLITGGLLALDVITTFLPIKVTLAIALTRCLYAGLSAVEAFRQRDYDASLSHFADAMMTLLFDSVGELALFRLLRHTPRPSSATSHSLHTQLSVPNTRIDGLTANAKGVYRDAYADYYVRSNDGTVFQIKSDFQGGGEQVQIINPNTRIETGLFLDLDQQGLWQKVGGVRGGGKRKAESLTGPPEATSPTPGPSQAGSSPPAPEAPSVWNGQLTVDGAAIGPFSLKDSSYAETFKLVNTSRVTRNEFYPFVWPKDKAPSDYRRQLTNHPSLSVKALTTADNIEEKITTFHQWGMQVDLNSLKFFPMPGAVAEELKELNGGLIASILNLQKNNNAAIERLIEPMAGSGHYSNYARALGFEGEMIVNDWNPLISWTQKEIVAQPDLVKQHIAAIKKDMFDLAQQRGISLDPELLSHRYQSTAAAKAASNAPNVSELREDVKDYFNDCIRTLVEIKNDKPFIAQPTRPSVISKLKNGRVVSESNAFLAALFYIAQNNAAVGGVVEIRKLLTGVHSLHFPITLMNRDFNILTLFSNISTASTNKINYISHIHSRAKKPTAFLNHDGWELLSREATKPSDFVVLSGHFSDVYLHENDFMRKIQAHVLPLNEKGVKVIITNTYSPYKENSFKALGFHTFRQARQPGPTAKPRAEFLLVVNDAALQAAKEAQAVVNASRTVPTRQWQALPPQVV